MTGYAAINTSIAAASGSPRQTCTAAGTRWTAPYRSWTLKAGRTAGGEPDECYIVGADQSKDRPDLVIEVIWTSGGIDKLALYQRLGIDEVWFWIAGHLEVHALRGDSYERVTCSRWLPGLDLDLMCTFLDRRSVHVAKRDYREALRYPKRDPVA